MMSIDEQRIFQRFQRSVQSQRELIKKHDGYFEIARKKRVEVSSPHKPIEFSYLSTFWSSFGVYPQHSRPFNFSYEIQSIRIS